MPQAPRDTALSTVHFRSNLPTEEQLRKSRILGRWLLLVPDGAFGDRYDGSFRPDVHRARAGGVRFPVETAQHAALDAAHVGVASRGAVTAAVDDARAAAGAEPAAEGADDFEALVLLLLLSDPISLTATSALGSLLLLSDPMLDGPLE